VRTVAHKVGDFFKLMKLRKKMKGKDTRKHTHGLAAGAADLRTPWRRTSSLSKGRTTAFRADFRTSPPDRELRVAPGWR
jgi:hypothetical protein